MSMFEGLTGSIFGTGGNVRGVGKFWGRPKGQLSKYKVTKRNLVPETFISQD